MYAVEMGSVVIMCISSFNKDSFRHSKVNKGIYRHTDSMEIA
jgi:hypothetical protein